MLKEKEKEILNFLLNGPSTAKDIASKVEISIQHCYRVLGKLQEKNLIIKDGQFYRLTNEGRIAIENADGGLRIHNIKVVLYSRDDYIRRDDLKELIEKARKAELNNWDAYYISLSKYGVDATVQVNVADKITVVIHLPEFRTTDLTKAYKKIHNDIVNVRKALYIEGIRTSPELLDINFTLSTIYAEYATRLPDETPVSSYEVNLNRNSKDLQGKETKQEARAWIDESKGYKELESNDAEYTENFLLMPERVAKIQKQLEANSEYLKNLGMAAQALAEAGKGFAENINSHIPYVQNASVALSKITQVIELQQQQQQMFLQAMENQNRMIELLSSHLMKGNGNDTSNTSNTDKQKPWSKFLPFLLVLLLLVATVKGVVF